MATEKNDLIVNQSAKQELTDIEGFLCALKRGLNSMIAILQDRSESEDNFSELKQLLSCVDQFNKWKGKMQPERIRGAALILLKNIYDHVKSLSSKELPIPELQSDGEGKISTPFLSEAAEFLGPEIILSNDQMILLIKLRKELAHFWSTSKITDKLEQKGFRNVLDEKSLQRLFQQEKYNQLVRIASGKEPQIGENAKILYPFRLLSENPVANKKPEDIYQDNIFKVIQKGETILAKKAATSGESGYDVLGNELPGIPGLDVQLPPIQYAQFDPTSLRLNSIIDGFVFYKEGAITIAPATLLQENHDDATKCDQSKSVVIQGNIPDHAQFKSKLHIAVTGSIGAAYLTTKGSVFVNKGIEGKERCKIEAGDEIRTDSINQSEVKLGGNLITYGSILHSHINAKSVCCFGRNGQIIGGKIKAWDDVCATLIGSDVGTETQIELGGELPFLQQENGKLLTEKQNLNEQLNQVLEKQSTLVNIKEKSSNLLPSQKKELEKIKLIINKITRRLDELETKINQSQTNINYSKNCIRTVRARKAIYPGTIVRIMDKILPIKKEMGPTTLRLEKGKIIVAPFQEREI